MKKLIKGIQPVFKSATVKQESTASAVRTDEGFIEITSLELLDELVGGLIDPEAIFCQLVDEESATVVSGHMATGL
jgi:hypothetical protein